jgi:hypothetical protein
LAKKGCSEIDNALAQGMRTAQRYLTTTENLLETISLRS